MELLAVSVEIIIAVTLIFIFSIANEIRDELSDARRSVTSRQETVMEDVASIKSCLEYLGDIADAMEDLKADTNDIYEKISKEDYMGFNKHVCNDAYELARFVMDICKTYIIDEIEDIPNTNTTGSTPLVTHQFIVTYHRKEN